MARARAVLAFGALAAAAGSAVAILGHQRKSDPTTGAVVAPPGSSTAEPAGHSRAPSTDPPTTLAPREIGLQLDLGALTERTEVLLALWSSEGARLELTWTPPRQRTPEEVDAERALDEGYRRMGVSRPTWQRDESAPSIDEARLDGADRLWVTVVRLPVADWSAIAWISHDGEVVGRSRPFRLSLARSGLVPRILWFNELGIVAATVVARTEERMASFEVTEDGERVGDTRRWIDDEHVFVAPVGATLVVEPTRIQGASTIDLPRSRSCLVEPGRQRLEFRAPAARVRLRASLPDGSPVAFDWKMWKLEVDGRERAVRPALRSEALDGWRGELGSGRYGLVASAGSASAPTFVRFDVDDAEDDGEQEVRVALGSEGTRVRMRLRTGDGRPMRSFAVHLARADARRIEETAFATCTTDSDGEARTPPMPDGDYLAVIEGRGVARILRIGAGLPVDLSWTVPRLRPVGPAGRVSWSIRGVPDELVPDVIVVFEPIPSQDPWLLVATSPIELPAGRWRLSLLNPIASVEPRLRPWSEIRVFADEPVEVEIDLTHGRR